MAGLTVAAAAEPGRGLSDWTLSAPDVPGSTTLTFAVRSAVGSVVSERTSNFEAPVTTYGLVPPVAVAASDGSGPSSSSASSKLHWLQVAPVRVRIWNWSPAETAPLGQVTPTTVTSPVTSWTGVTAPAFAVVIGSGRPAASIADRVPLLAARIETTDAGTKPTSRTWLGTGCALAGEDWGRPVTIGANARTLARAKIRPRATRGPAPAACPAWEGCPGFGQTSWFLRSICDIPMSAR